MTDKALPSQPTLLRKREDLDFFHQRSVQVPQNFSAYEAYCRMTDSSSAIMRGAFWLRDRISSIFGVTTIGGFRHKASQSPPEVGDKLDFFLVEGVSDTQLVLTSRDRHLDVMLSLTVGREQGRGSFVTATTSVVTHNLFGRLCMLPVAPAHHVIVWQDMKKLAAA